MASVLLNLFVPFHYAKNGWSDLEIGSLTLASIAFRLLLASFVVMRLFFANRVVFSLWLPLAGSFQERPSVLRNKLRRIGVVMVDQPQKRAAPTFNRLSKRIACKIFCKALSINLVADFLHVAALLHITIQGKSRFSAFEIGLLFSISVNLARR